MKYQTDDTRITGMEEVAAPAALIDAIPVPDATTRLVFDSRRRIAAALRGEPGAPLLCVVGPCSIHDPSAAMEYAEKLRNLAEEIGDALHIVMRVYFEKPRTTVGWKGLINDPDLDGSYQINRGLTIARTLLRDITSLGLPCGTEWLDPISPQYLGDFVSWGAVGARTTESQVHRQLASGLSCPVGFKNSTNGDVQVAVDAVNSASHPHIFLSVTKQGSSAIFSTSGNHDCHVILRGGSNGTNFDAASIQAASERLAAADLPAQVMVDASHANSQKQHRNQLKVCADLAEQLRNPAGSPLFGLMIESNLIEGRQDINGGSELVRGQSITDACIGWNDTEQTLRELADAAAARA